MKNTANLSLYTLFFTFIFINCFSQPNLTIRKYFVAFSSIEGLSFESKAGHAFISIGAGNPMTCSTLIDVYGFYPKGQTSSNAAKSYVFGPVPGKLYFDNLLPQKMIILNINELEKMTLNNVIDKWKNANYELGENDCLSFVIDMASTTKRIILPDRSGFTTFPNKYLQKMIELNKNNPEVFEIK